jgi:large subunit ribosomal protein L39e
MVKKSRAKKTKLAKKIKQNKRIPLLAVLRTHRKIQQNKFARDWKHKKLRIKD